METKCYRILRAPRESWRGCTILRELKWIEIQSGISEFRFSLNRGLTLGCLSLSNRRREQLMPPLYTTRNRETLRMIFQKAKLWIPAASRRIRITDQSLNTLRRLWSLLRRTSTRSQGNEFDFLELGGGRVRNNAFTASLNLSGASDSRSGLRVLFFFFVRLFTYSLSAPSRQRLFVFYEPINVSRQPIPSNTLPVSEALPRRLFNGDFHSLAIRDAAIVPTKLELGYSRSFATDTYIVSRFRKHLHL